MSGLLFQDAQPATTLSPNRADIVCFIGFVGRRDSPLPDAVKLWLQDQGWRPRGKPVDDDDPLWHTPVPLESFDAFDQLFAWETRPAEPRAFTFTTWLGAAVRSFFRQGGARCFVVRADDPGRFATLADTATPADTAAHQREQSRRLARLLPGYSDLTLAPADRINPASPADPTTWKGLGVLLGLEEAAFVCLPDLPELVADATLEPAGLAPVAPGPEVFSECTPETESPLNDVRQISQSPACNEAGYLRWRIAVHRAAQFVYSQRKDVALVLTLPLPAPSLTRDYTRNLEAGSNVLGLGRPLDEPDGIATAFVQLCFPWLVTPGAEALPGGLEPPDGVVAGVLARTIPELGVAHSIGRQVLRGVHGFAPELPGPDLVLDTPKSGTPALIHRVTLLGRTPDAERVLSDVTTSLSKSHRPASVGRLTAAILRTARSLGNNLVFEPSGEELWRKIRTQLDRLLADFYAAGALFGETADAAYSIRCDATTTSQNDLDNGRIIAEVRFAPSQPVGLITVVLSLREGTVTAVEVPA